MNGTTTILVCDGDELVQQVLQEHLKTAGFQVLSAYDGHVALKKMRQTLVDMVLLDAALPKISGHELCAQIRKTSNVPIILLGTEANAADRVAGLEIGADDYIEKPFFPKEVVARVKAILRRMSAEPENLVLGLGKLRVFPKSYEVFVEDEKVQMTPREIDLVAFLMSRAGKAIAREEILNTIWGFDYYGNVRTVDTLVARIRGKIPEEHSKVVFRSIYGVGYMVEERCG